MIHIKIIHTLSIIIMMMILQNCIPYLYHLAKNQTQIIYNREKITEVIQKSNTIDTTKFKLSLILKAREFAVQNLHLNPDGGFLYYTQLDREEIGWHVTASYPLEFKSYTWWFPIAGTVPYKGFFDLDKAKEQEKELMKMGLDTRIRITAGYSTLGWFSDPVFSPQLRLNDDDLVGLVFHEMAHATVYFDGESKFNESFATFVEEKGLEDFYKNSTDKERLTKRKENKELNQKLLEFIRQTSRYLDELYKSNQSEESKLKSKQEIIEGFKSKVIEFLTEKNVNPQWINRIKDKKYNNEDFIGALRYNSGTTFFQQKFIECNMDYQKFYKEIQSFQKLSKKEREKLLD